MEVSGQLHAAGALPPGKKAGSHWLGGCVYARANLSALDKRQIFFVLSEFKYHPVYSLVFIDHVMPAHFHRSNSHKEKIYKKFSHFRLLSYYSEYVS
jgi:hypothetical protein